MHRLRVHGGRGACRFALAGCLALLAAGCTTLQPVDRQSAVRDLEPGDEILVTTRDGRELELLFGDWTSQALTGSDELGLLQSVENDDIASVQVERHSTARSVGLGAAVAAFLVGIAAAASDDGGLY